MLSISLIQLSYITAVHKTKNFGLAAKSCFVTQPTLSMQIQKLEEELGVLVFDRSKKPVQETTIGKKIIEQAQLILQEVSRVDELIKAEKGELTGEFRLGVIPTLAPYLIPLFIQSFSQKYPRVQLIVEELQTTKIIQKLKEDNLDAGLLVTPLNFNGIIEKVLFYEPFVVYISENHTLHKLGKITENDLDLNDVWLLSEGHCLRNQIIRLCEKKVDNQIRGKNVRFESGNLETLKKLVDQNLGSILLPHLAINQMLKEEIKAKIKFFKDPIPTREVSLVYSRSFLKKGIIEALETEICASIPKKLKKPPLRTNIIEISKL
jgi:LysR family transcriptional regulator, hydrogen peroxide-inducible genes activator